MTEHINVLLIEEMFLNEVLTLPGCSRGKSSSEHAVPIAASVRELNKLSG